MNTIDNNATNANIDSGIGGDEMPRTGAADFHAETATADTTSHTSAHPRATASNTDAHTITITVPRGGLMSGFDAIFKVLFLFAGWMLVAIAYLCVPGSLAAGALGLFVGVSNLANGLGAALLGFGCGICCLGLCLPLLLAAGRGRAAALAATRQLFGSSNAAAMRAGKAPSKMLLIMLVVSLAGAAIAGTGALLGGSEVIVLPEFLDRIFSTQPPVVTGQHLNTPGVSVAA